MPSVKYFDIFIGHHVTSVGIVSELHTKETFGRKELFLTLEVLI
jgi:hypothetical protein